MSEYEGLELEDIAAECRTMGTEEPFFDKLAEIFELRSWSSREVIFKLYEIRDEVLKIRASRSSDND